MQKNHGYTLIELVTFITILGLVSAMILSGTVLSLRYSPIANKQLISTQAASGCLEYILGQRDLNGFDYNSQNCPGSPEETITPSFCTNLTTPNNFTITVKISCTTIPNISGAQKFKMIEVKSSDTHTTASTTLKALIADY